jgi:hypothetical protein
MPVSLSPSPPFSGRGLIKNIRTICAEQTLKLLRSYSAFKGKERLRRLEKYVRGLGYNEFDFFVENEGCRPFDGCKIEI